MLEAVTVARLEWVQQHSAQHHVPTQRHQVSGCNEAAQVQGKGACNATSYKPVFGRASRHSIVAHCAILEGLHLELAKADDNVLCSEFRMICLRRKSKV
jgi:hypothetical protein